ncbi:MAG: glycoside hydrolase family 2 TIM barrel-domain containing protein [Gemmatimonadales bacterium]|nr:glycoside hydrolase family 2 TIM barrel-domain containing protein [Gemmatimonadales bacterium]
MKRRAFVQGMTVAGAAGALGSPRSLPGWTTEGSCRVSRLDTGWKFLQGDPSGAESVGLDDAAWQPATLPHTARIEALVTGPAGSPEAQWQGVCWYRRRLRLESEAAGEKVLLRFEGAMNVADVWLDGERVGGHLGGYLPFVLDLSERVQPGRDHLLAVRLDNRDNPITGPKPLAQLDFNTYHGLYRPVHLIRTNRLHITDPLLADRPASGAVFVTYPRVSRESATVRVQTHVHNEHAEPRSFRVRATLRAPGGAVVTTATSAAVTLRPGADTDVPQELEVRAPHLWSPAAPNLHTLDCEVVTDAGTVDRETVRVGIRRIAVSREGFWINGQKLFLRGTNRHQEYPYIGYALSDAAQYRDARKIKEAGFDYVRLSHYAHAPAFMDACDELGLVVMDCIPGWQYFNPDPAFAELQYRNCRDLLRRDRNHPCVILWEVSLNESAMPPEFVARTQTIAHEEYPGDQCFTAGWVHGYDVFIDARQHGGCRHETDHACLVSEYGDWEYYAMNAGLDQGAWQNLTPAESNSRQLRWQGERALLQQATNFQEAHNDNLGTVAFADGLWVMYDYNRGYSPDIESSGCMDIFRLPKYSYHFFRSQRPAAERLTAAASGPMVFIASDWTSASATDVRVFSNCDEVALLLNGCLLERKGPDRDRMSTRLAHPPFTFRTAGFRPGTLEAVGYVAGRRAARHVVRTPGAIDRLSLAFDFSGWRRDRERRDDIFCYASLRDAHGTVVPDAWENVAFGVTGGATLVGANPFASDAGIASILVQTEPGAAPGSVHALAIVPNGGSARILGASLALEGRAPPREIRRTTGGAELLVHGQVVASLSAAAPKFRIPASAAPDRRDPFRR